MSSLKGKKLVVTGGTRGIGKALVEELYLKGAEVIFSYRQDPQAAEEIVGTLKAIFKEKFPEENLPLIKAFRLDLGQTESIELFAKEVLEEFEAPYALINNAGITRDKLLLQTKEPDIQDVFQINIQGVISLSRLFVKSMIRQKEGAILNISSVVAQRGSAGQCVYAATKAALEGFTRALSQEIGGRNVRVNALAPGFIETDMTQNLNSAYKEKILAQIPLERFGKPREVAQVAAFLVSPEASYVTGQTWGVNGGLWF